MWSVPSRASAAGPVCSTLLSLFLSLGFLATAPPLLAVKVPRPVSPGSAAPGSVAEAKCPTFSWSGVSGAGGYELAVFRVSDAAEEPVLVLRASVPGDARGYTPPVGSCLERGQRYAWTVAPSDTERDAARTRSPVDAPEGRDLDSAGLAWSPPYLFEIEAAPSAEELERAIATIERHLATRDDESADEGVGSSGEGRSVVVRSNARDPRARPGSEAAPGGSHPRHNGSAPGVLRVKSATTPNPGDASLRVSNQIHLAESSSLFKDGDVFLWDNGPNGNLALGRQALALASGTATRNTALGRGALQNTTGGILSEGAANTAVGDLSLQANTTGARNTANGVDTLRYNTTGVKNTAIGFEALLSNLGGSINTAIGGGALRQNTSGTFNTASGAGALQNNTTGFYNTATGAYSLYDSSTGKANTSTGFQSMTTNTTGSYNTANGYLAANQNTSGARNTATGAFALIANTAGNRNSAFGNGALEDNTIGDRNTALGNNAGSNNTSGDDSIFINNDGNSSDDATIKIGTQGTQQSTFVAGIHSALVAGATGMAVLADATGKLGTAVSSRRFKQDIQDVGPLADRLLELRPVSFRYREHAEADSGASVQFGLIAEEVAEVFPELVVFDGEGRPQTVKYHLLSTLLLSELQEQELRVERLRARHEAELRSLGERLRELEEREDRSPAPSSGEEHGDRHEPAGGLTHGRR